MGVRLPPWVLVGREFESLLGHYNRKVNMDNDPEPYYLRYFKDTELFTPPTLIIKQEEDNKMKLYSVAAFTPEGAIVLEPTALTAISAQAARDKAIRLLAADVNLDEVTVTINPLG